MEITRGNAFVCLRCPGNHRLMELQFFLEIILSIKPKRFSHIGGLDKYLKPETNIFAPENRHPGKGDCYWKPPYLGAVLVSGSVSERFTGRWVKSTIIRVPKGDEHPLVASNNDLFARA